MSLIKQYLHQIMTQMTDNIIDRDELQATYINRVLDDMDIKVKKSSSLFDYMDVEFDKYSVDELIEQVDQDYPHISGGKMITSKKQMLSIMSQCDTVQYSYKRRKVSSILSSL